MAASRRSISAQSGNLLFDQLQLQALQRVVVTQKQAPADKAAAVDVELVIVGRGAHPAAAEQDLRRLAADDAGAELHPGGRGGRALPPPKLGQASCWERVCEYR